jgi:hypothetical protein
MMHFNIIYLSLRVCLMCSHSLILVILLGSKSDIV